MAISIITVILLFFAFIAIGIAAIGLIAHVNTTKPQWLWVLLIIGIVLLVVALGAWLVQTPLSGIDFSHEIYLEELEMANSACVPTCQPCLARTPTFGGRRVITFA